MNPHFILNIRMLAQFRWRFRIFLTLEILSQCKFLTIFLPH